MSGAQVEGAALGSRELSFVPGPLRPGRYEFSTAGAGSVTLVLQTVLPPLLRSSGPSTLILEGGTHNPFAPPFDFLARAFVPLVNRMGPAVRLALDRPGFYPAGGGRLRAWIEPAKELLPFDLLDRGRILRIGARALIAALPRHIGERELDTVRRILGLDPDALALEEVRGSPGPGNALLIDIACEHVTEVFTGFGQRGVRAETVAERVARDALSYLDAKIPVGPHLADQLLLPLTLAGGGAFRTLAPTLHTTTNVEVVRRFLDIRMSIRQIEGKAWLVSIAG